MPTFAIGDIHGNLPALVDLLGQIEPDAAAGDAVVFLGDYIDRGAEVKECIDAILAFTQRTPATVVTLLGNHEEWMLDTMADHRRHAWWLAMDPIGTIRSYSTAAADALLNAARAAGAQLFLDKCALPYELFFDALPESHRAFYTKLVTHFVTSDCICVHGGLDASLPPDEFDRQRQEDLVWGTPAFADLYRGEKVVVYGHHNNADVDDTGWPLPKVVGQTIGIDTIGHGVLTGMRFPERRLYQSKRYGVRWL